MKRLLLIIAACFLLDRVQAQDIPLFSQKLTNSFIYNPAMAGHTFGSLTYSHRNNYSGVTGSPQNDFLSLHTPFAGHRFGTGFNLYQDQVNIIKNTYFSAAFAYHLRFDKYKILSFGISGEYNTMRLTGVTDAIINNDPILMRYSNANGKPDFSFGMLYQNRFIKAGISANRLSTAWLAPTNKRVLSNYYSGFVQGMIPLRDGQDLLEPYFAFRKFSESSDTYDIGIYYTYDNKITAGGATRAGSVVNFTLAYKITKVLLIGYSREMITSPIGGFVGSSNEITLRMDFKEDNYQTKFKANYKNSISYRRKTLNTAAVKRSAGGRTPKALSKANKRVAAYSPNNRYQNTKKLSMGKKVSGSKGKYGKKIGYNKKKTYSKKKYVPMKKRKK